MSERSDAERHPNNVDLTETHVVTVFLRDRSDVLLLQRSDAVGSYSGRWGAVAGHAEGETRPEGASRKRERGARGAKRTVSDGDPDDAALEEIREETGLDAAADTTLVRRGDSFEVTDADLGKRWLVHPYLFDCDSRHIEPNEETADFEWASPTAILRRETVPDLWTSYDRVRPTAETVAADRDHGSASLSVRALEVLRDEAALAVERTGEGAAEETATGDGTTERSWADLTAVARTLLEARPSMAVVTNRVNRAVHAAGESATAAALETAAREGIDRALDADDTAAATAADRLPDRVATLSRSGTVADAVERADPAAVLVAESRPGREAVGTAERVAERTDAAVTLTTDAALAEQLATFDVAALVVGADTVLPDGSVLNKVGTRAAATAAASEGIDCLVVTASDKIAPADGDRGDAAADRSVGPEDRSVDREERDPAELYDGDADLHVANPTFDVTPADRVDALVTERGVLDADEVRAVAAEHRTLSEWDE
ncbi:initiation factor 2B [Halobacteriales archaeon QS_9_67_15]|nr:MAG: initiation factor 2B [Halobacteriales archaeon QS_9_67_15]